MARAVWAGAKGRLWIAPVSGAEKAKQLTYARGENSSPRWSPDGKRIAFTSHRGDHSFIAVYEFGSDRLRYVAPTRIATRCRAGRPTAANSRMSAGMARSAGCR